MRKKSELRFLTILKSSMFRELRAFAKTGKRPKGQPVTTLWLAENLAQAISEIDALLSALDAHDGAMKELSKKWDKILSVENKDSKVDSRSCE